jgi:hypothetical protein
LRDTSAALQHNPALAKAYFRATSALLALSRWTDALDCIQRGKSLPAESAADKQELWNNLEIRAHAGLQKEAEKAERERRSKVGKEALRRAILVSNHNLRAARPLDLTQSFPSIEG